MVTILDKTGWQTDLFLNTGLGKFGLSKELEIITMLVTVTESQSLPFENPQVASEKKFI